MTLTIDVGTAFKWIVILLFVAVTFGIVSMLYSKIRGFFASRKFDGADRVAMKKRWEEVERMADTSGEMSRKLAVIEADKLLDHALKALAMPGTTLGERLKFAQYKYPELREVWFAHKIRNQLAHEASFHLDSRLAKNALRSFRKALERLGAI